MRLDGLGGILWPRDVYLSDSVAFPTRNRHFRTYHVAQRLPLL